MIKVFDREEFVEEVFEMEAEYLDKFGLEEVVEDEDTELNVWFKDFNSNEQRENFIQNKEDLFYRNNLLGGILNLYSDLYN